MIFLVKINIAGEKRENTGNKDHHLWMRRDPAGSGQKALSLVLIVSFIILIYFIFCPLLAGMQFNILLISISLEE